MGKNFVKYLVSFGLGFLIVGLAVLVYFFTENPMATLGTATFFYTISKPIQSDLEKWAEPKKKLRVLAIYEEKETAFEKKINDSIDDLTKAGKSIVEINVLSTKRAVIQYEDKTV